jgi:hypothetical protein
LHALMNLKKKTCFHEWIELIEIYSNDAIDPVFINCCNNFLDPPPLKRYNKKKWIKKNIYIFFRNYEKEKLSSWVGFVWWSHSISLYLP